MHPSDTSAPASSDRPWSQPGTRLSHVPWFVTFALSAVGLAIIVSQVFKLQTFGLGPISTSYYYIVVALFLPVAFLVTPARLADAEKMRWYDWLLGAAALGSCLYFGAHTDEIRNTGWESLAQPPVMVMVAGLVLLSLAAVRGCASLPLFVICANFAAFPIHTGQVPGLLWGVQLSLSETALGHSLGVEGSIGSPIRVMADLPMGFMVLGVASVMGAILADILVAAAVPALLFFLMLLIRMDGCAARRGPKGLALVCVAGLAMRTRNVLAETPKGAE